MTRKAGRVLWASLPNPVSSCSYRTLACFDTNYLDLIKMNSSNTYRETRYGNAAFFRFQFLFFPFRGHGQASQ